MRIPEDGLSREAIFERLDAYRQDDTPWREGRTWASLLVEYLNVLYKA